MSDQQTELEKLRTAIINDLAPLVENTGLEPAQQFDLLLASARLSGSEEQLAKARQAALQIESEEGRANALLDLLDAVDVAIGDVNYSEFSQPEDSNGEQAAAPPHEQH